MISICICTPCYGGVVTSQYAGSLANTVEYFRTNDIHYSLYMLANESQVHRARNKCVAFVREHTFTHLLFIDADLGWEPNDVQKLIDAGKRIIGGTYPVKKLPIKLNYNAESGMVANAAGVLEVRHVPTGFLLIDVRVFDDLEKHVESCMKEDLTTGKQYCYVEYFRPGIYHLEDLSEDWAFCRVARTHAERVFLHTKVVLPHVGSFEYRAGTV